MVASNALEALTQSPLRLVRSPWPFRSLAYLIASFVPAAVIIGIVLIGSQIVDIYAYALFGMVLLLPLTPLIAMFERVRVRIVDNEPLPSRGALRSWRASTATGLSQRWRRLPTPQLWREAAFSLVAAVALWWIDLGMLSVAMGIPGILMSAPLQPTDTHPLASGLLAVLGLLLIPLSFYPVTAWAGARAAMSRAVLYPGDAAELARSRARLVDAFELERRRIERDLHDGAQQRLVALSMNLGVAKLSLAEGSESLQAVEAAHEQARLALSELRGLIRGVHPQVLSGRGLASALRDVAGRSPIPISVELDGLPRLPSAIEVNTYYVVAEALANVAKHSKASRGWVTGSFDGRTLRLEVGDDGVGGAVLKTESGVVDRVATLDGQLTLSSPRGGPTRLRVEIPC